MVRPSLLMIAPLLPHIHAARLPCIASGAAVTPTTPTWLVRHDAHMGLANSAALRLAGIGRDTPDPPGGAILRQGGPDGQPTGLLTDAAMQLLAGMLQLQPMLLVWLARIMGTAWWRLKWPACVPALCRRQGFFVPALLLSLPADIIPPLSVEERQQAFEAAVQHALSKGITMVHCLGRWGCGILELGKWGRQLQQALSAHTQLALFKAVPVCASQTLLCCCCRVAFMEGEEAAWQDLEEVYLPAANQGKLPLRIYAFVALPTWQVALPTCLPDRKRALYAGHLATDSMNERTHLCSPTARRRRMAERVKQLGKAHPGGMLHWGGVKEFAGMLQGCIVRPLASLRVGPDALACSCCADGSLGSRTALFHEPYADEPGSSGTRTIELDRLRQLVVEADAAGLQVAVHAIGDRAVDEVLDIYAELAHRKNSSSGGVGGGSVPVRRRHRIEHAQHLSSPEVAQRLAAAGVVVTPNPLHLLADMAVLQPRLGRERAGAGRTYALRTLVEAGATTACGSDWPVVPLDALGEACGALLHSAAGTCMAVKLRLPPRWHVLRHGTAAGSLYAAVHRQAPGGGAGPWAPEEALSVAEALEAHTLAGAAAAGLERELGSIAVGKLADFVVLGATPGDAAPEVCRTVVGGKCVYGCPT